MARKLLHAVLILLAAMVHSCNLHARVGFIPAEPIAPGSDYSSTKNALVEFDGSTGFRAGRLSVDGSVSFDTGSDVKNPATAANLDLNGSDAVFLDPAPWSSTETPRHMTIEGNMSLTDGNAYVFGVDGLGATNDVDHLNSLNARTQIFRGVPANSRVDAIYGSNSIVLDLSSAARGLNAAMYSDLNATSTGNMMNVIQPDTRAHGSVGVYSFLNGFSDQNAYSAAQAFNGISRNIRNSTPAANRLANRLLANDTLTGHETGQAVTGNASSMEKIIPTSRLWLEMNGHMTNTTSDFWVSELDSSSLACYGGVDFQTGILDRVGASMGYSTTSISTGAGGNSGTEENYQALTYASDSYYGFDFSVMAGASYERYSNRGAITLGNSFAQESIHGYTVLMDAEISRTFIFDAFTVSGIAGYLTERVTRSGSVVADSRQMTRNWSRGSEGFSQFRFGGEITTKRLLTGNDKAGLSAHWLQRTGETRVIPADSYLNAANWVQRATPHNHNGVALNAVYGVPIGKDADLSIRYTAVAEDELVAHEAVGTFRLRW